MTTPSINKTQPRSEAFSSLQQFIANMDRRIYALLVGLGLGLCAGAIVVLLAVAGPLITLAAVGGILAGLYVLTDVRVALFGMLAIMLLLPFGTMPFSLGLTPTLLEVSLVAFLMVYLFLWMTGKRQRLTLTPVHPFIALYLMWLILAFALGLRWGMPTAALLRDFAVNIVIIALPFVLVDLLRDPKTLRRLVLIILVLVTAQAAIAVGLFLLNDVTAESILVRLSRIGYPAGGVIRYIESNPELGERAIGTWVDPNALGSILATGAMIIASQVFARRPVLKYRFLTFGSLGIITLGLILTSSRASFLAFGAGLVMIALLRYRRFIPLLILGGSLMFLLPQTQEYVDRIFQALRGEDLATQMRIGEWTDSLELISQYPLTGIGFTGTPELGLYTDVANMYLIMGNQIGVTGIALFLLAMSAILYYAYRARHIALNDPELDSIHLGFNLALLTALINAFADLYYFRLDFQSAIAWFWVIVSLALASSRLVYERQNKTGTQ